MTFSNLRLAATMLLFAALAGCGESHSWRQKTIIEVETPNGVVSGGNVLDVSIHFNPAWETSLANQTGSSSSSFGQSSAVEVQPGKYLLALTASTTWSASSAGIKVVQGGNREMENPEIFDLISKGVEPRSLPESSWPLFAVFDDPADPKSIRLVKDRDLKDIFGEGYKIKDLKVEIGRKIKSDTRLEIIYSWLCEYQEKVLYFDGTKDGSVKFGSLPSSLSSGYMMTGKCK